MLGNKTKRCCYVLGLGGLLCAVDLPAQWDYAPPPDMGYAHPQRPDPRFMGFPPPSTHDYSRPSWNEEPYWLVPSYQRPPSSMMKTGDRQVPSAPPPQVTAKPAAEDDYIRNAQKIVAAADWDKQRNVTVELTEYRYTPNTLKFKVGTPYKLELVNMGKTKHYFTAPEFFRAIATRKVQSNHDGEVKAPYFTALEMMPKGGQLDLYFVPVNKGSYQVNCTIPGHTEQGMVGQLIIE